MPNFLIFLKCKGFISPVGHFLHNLCITCTDIVYLISFSSNFFTFIPLSFRNQEKVWCHWGYGIPESMRYHMITPAEHFCTPVWYDLSQALQYLKVSSGSSQISSGMTQPLKYLGVTQKDKTSTKLSLFRLGTSNLRYSSLVCTSYSTWGLYLAWNRISAHAKYIREVKDEHTVYCLHSIKFLARLLYPDF